MENLQKSSAEWRKNISEDEKKRISKLHSEYNNKIWKDIKSDPSKYEDYCNKLKAAWNNRSYESKKQHSDQIRNRWKNMDNDKKELLIRRLISASGGINKFHQLFEYRFNHSSLNETYRIRSEYYLSNNGINHYWDYAIFNNSKLECVIDLDGAYFHADNCDYDGLHSKLEYDEKKIEYF